MFNHQWLPALGLAFLALFTSAHTWADDSTSLRSPEWAQPVGNQYNLHQMTPTLYRSALPDSNAVPLLEKLKVGTVINFLPESDDSWLKNSDIRQIQLIYRTNHVDDADVLAALRAIRDSEANGAVLMHCKHGSDRTGLMAAMYRVVVQGWSKEEALNEMTLGGFGSSKGFKDGVKAKKKKGCRCQGCFNHRRAVQRKVRQLMVLIGAMPVHRRSLSRSLAISQSCHD